MGDALELGHALAGSSSTRAESRLDEALAVFEGGLALSIGLLLAVEVFDLGAKALFKSALFGVSLF